MMALEKSWDAIVIGGGPAGSSVATFLARERRRVLLLERERFPREHIGESLLPGVLPYLDALGVRETIEREGFERKEGQTFVWGRDRTPWHIDFRELDVHPYAYFVERARFDHLLLEHARRSGADVREGHAVDEIVFESGRATGVIARGPDGARLEAGARFVVDASGQTALTARAAKLLRPVKGLRNLALWSYWEGAARLPAPHDRNILTVTVPEGWIWVIPLRGRTSVGIVTSAATRAERAQLGPAAFYQGVLDRCPPVSRLLAGARRVAGVSGARDWSYRARRFSGPGILLAGDAACFIDPILSTGVHLAMTSAYWAAACVNTSLESPARERFLRRFYDETYLATYRELLTQVKAMYTSEVRRDSVYWTAKKILRTGGTMRPELAFLFITAGLLRNAAVDAPHDAAAEARMSLGARAGLPGGFSPSVPTLVWRTGAQGDVELVTVRAEGLRLNIVRHEPRGLRDRPRGGFACIELCDAEAQPLGLVLVEERRRGAPGHGRLTARFAAYPGQDVHVSVDAALAACDDPASPIDFAAVRVRLRKALRRTLPDGIFVTPAREHRSGRVIEPPLTVVFEAPDRRRVYLMIECRVPPALTEIPILRTRFVDVTVRPARAAEARALLDPAVHQLARALRTVPTRKAAFDVAERVLANLAVPGFRHVASGRLGYPGQP
jgi:flavin-dependent dehydrogenase